MYNILLTLKTQAGNRHPYFITFLDFAYFPDIFISGTANLRKSICSQIYKNIRCKKVT